MTSERPALLTDAWIEACNRALADAPGPADGRALVVTELVTDAAAGSHGAVTLVADESGVRLVAGEDAGSSAWITLSAEDAEALHAGALDPAAALAQGRVRVRGDLRAIVAASSVLADAHARLRASGT